MGTKDEKKRKGMGRGNKALDELTAGFLPSELIIIGGRPAIGKTTLCLDIAQTAAKREDKLVAIFSMEMTKEELVSRMLCSGAKVDESKLRGGSVGGSDWATLTGAAGALSELPIFIDDTPALSVTESREKAERLNTDISGGIGMLVIDSLQLIKRPENEEGISEVMKGLKSLARELAVPVIVTSQLRRTVEDRADKRPQVTDIPQSQEIEPYADTIMFIHRDEVCANSDDNLNKERAEIIVAKQRNGRTGGVVIMMTRLISVFCFLLILATPVFADQCAWLPDYAQAGNAFMFLREGETIYEYCAPCGETIARPVVVKQLKVRKVPIEPPHSELQDVPEYKTVGFLLRPPESNYSQGDGTGYYEVTVNGKGIDLAYIYIPFKGGYRNLATLVGCPCDFVPVVLPQEKMPQGNKGTRGRAF